MISAPTVSTIAVPILLLALGGFAGSIIETGQARQAATAKESIHWRKIALDRQFRAEGVAVADVNRDGKMDILAGNIWYEAPSWTPHEIEPVQHFDPATGYSNCFLSWAADVNHDGWPDQIVVGFPGQACLWRENPRGKPGPWKEHIISDTACNESPNYAYLLNGHTLTLVFPVNELQMVWLEPGKDPTQPWIRHVISAEHGAGTMRFSHGLGVGDVTGNGRADVLVKEGIYMAPTDRRLGPWTFVPTNLGPDCAQMQVYDVNHDGRPDVITSSAHHKGIWWWEQQRTQDGKPAFVQHLIDDSISQTHSLVLADIDGDGVMDIVTGKRFWAHGPEGDVDPSAPAMLYWYQLKRSHGKVEWIRHTIDDDSGVGTQFEVTDVNGDGLPDVVVSNKKGVFVFLQERTGD